VFGELGDLHLLGGLGSSWIVAQVTNRLVVDQLTVGVVRRRTLPEVLRLELSTSACICSCAQPPNGSGPGLTRGRTRSTS